MFCFFFLFFCQGYFLIYFYFKGQQVVWDLHFPLLLLESTFLTLISLKKMIFSHLPFMSLNATFERHFLFPQGCDCFHGYLLFAPQSVLEYGFLWVLFFQELIALISPSLLSTEYCQLCGHLVPIFTIPFGNGPLPIALPSPFLPPSLLLIPQAREQWCIAAMSKVLFFYESIETHMKMYSCRSNASLFYHKILTAVML